MEIDFATACEIVSDALPDRDALVQGDRRVTYRAFEEAAARFAAAIEAAGVPEGAKIALYLYNGPEYMLAEFGAFKHRAVPVNVNYRYLDNELAYLIDNSAAERALRAVALGRNYVQFPIMRSVLGRGRWMAGSIGAVSVQGTRTSHNRWSPDVSISDARRSSWKMEQQFTRRCAHGWSAAFFNPISQSSARVFSAAVTTHRPSTATCTALHTLRIGLADTGWRWSRWTSEQLLALSLSTYRIAIAHIP